MREWWEQVRLSAGFEQAGTPIVSCFRKGSEGVVYKVRICLAAWAGSPAGGAFWGPSETEGSGKVLVAAAQGPEAPGPAAADVGGASPHGLQGACCLYSIPVAHHQAVADPGSISGVCPSSSSAQWLEDRKQRALLYDSSGPHTGPIHHAGESAKRERLQAKSRRQGLG